LQLDGIRIESEREMSQTEYEAAVAAFIRSKGITRCPTVCLAPTHGSVAATDRMALRRRAEHLEEVRQEKLRNAWRAACLWRPVTTAVAVPVMGSLTQVNW
jgi:hypothetical protein